jgi:hypothetical protein
MMAGLLLLITTRSPLKIPGSVAGYLSLLLSVVGRHGLAGVGFLLILKRQSARDYQDLFSIMLLVAACCRWPAIPPSAMWSGIV